MGQTFQTDDTSAALSGISNNHTDKAGAGVYGESDASGVVGKSRTWHGVVGISSSTTGGFGVWGTHTGGGTGVVGESASWHAVGGFSKSTTGGAGVYGEGVSGIGVMGKSASGTGVWAESGSAEAVHAVTNSNEAAVAAYNTNAGDGFAVYGKKTGDKGFAGFFEGNVWVGGDMSVGKDISVSGKIDCPKGTLTCFDVSISNADCAEEFELAGAEVIEPGTLMSFRTDGTLCPSLGAYDSKVAGVISGAGEYKPGIVLDKRQGKNRVPIALMGKVFCKVDAEFSPIEVGDLLTTSPTPGHAMKATDPLKAFGSVIGKALRSQREGRGMIPVLVALQ
jgi:hypothetical protein